MTHRGKLTDEQCDEFRRLQMSFNDMVRAIYEAGIGEEQLQVAVEVLLQRGLQFFGQRAALVA